MNHGKSVRHTGDTHAFSQTTSFFFCQDQGLSRHLSFACHREKCTARFAPCPMQKCSGVGPPAGELLPPIPYSHTCPLAHAIDLLMGLFRGAVFHHAGVPKNCPLALMGRFPFLMGRFPTLMGRLPDCLNGLFSLLKIPSKTAL